MILVEKHQPDQIKVRTYNPISGDYRYYFKLSNGVAKLVRKQYPKHGITHTKERNFSPSDVSKEIRQKIVDKYGIERFEYKN